MQKASLLGVEGTHEICRVDLHPSLVGGVQAKVHAMPDGHAVFENVPSSVLQPKSAWCTLFGGVWRKPLDILRVRGQSLCHGTASCLSVFCKPGASVPVLAGQHGMVLGAQKCFSSAPSLNDTWRGRCHLSCHVHRSCPQVDRV